MGITLAAPATMQAAKWREEERRYRFGQRRCRPRSGVRRSGAIGSVSDDAGREVA